jgi:vitamin B12 transporter
VESFVEYHAPPQLTLRLDYTFTQATDDESHHELLRRPKHKGNFDAQWQATTSWLINLDVLWIGAWAVGTRDTFTTVTAPGYTTVNLATSYDLCTTWPSSLALIISSIATTKIRAAFFSHTRRPPGFE